MLFWPIFSNNIGTPGFCPFSPSVPPKTTISEKTIWNSIFSFFEYVFEGEVEKKVVINGVFVFTEILLSSTYLEIILEAINVGTFAVLNIAPPKISEMFTPFSLFLDKWFEGKEEEEEYAEKEDEFENRFLRNINGDLSPRCTIYLNSNVRFPDPLM